MEETEAVEGIPRTDLPEEDHRKVLLEEDLPEEVRRLDLQVGDLPSDHLAEEDLPLGRRAVEGLPSALRVEEDFRCTPGEAAAGARHLGHLLVARRHQFLTLSIHMGSRGRVGDPTSRRRCSRTNFLRGTGMEGKQFNISPKFRPGRGLGAMCPGNWGVGCGAVSRKDLECGTGGWGYP